MEGIFKVLVTLGCKRRRPARPTLDNPLNDDADANDNDDDAAAVLATRLFTLRLTAGMKTFDDDIVVVVVSVEII